MMNKKLDILTLIAISMLAAIVTTSLHEHFGHGLACVLLGGHLAEINAFYVDCTYGNMPDLAIRFEALAGPLVSLLSGIIGLALLRRLSKTPSTSTYFVWLLSVIGLMTATGYLMFSGILGIGDFGTDRNGVLYQLSPEWLWRVGITLLGLVGYIAVIWVSLISLDWFIGGEGKTRIGLAQKLTLISYISGSVIAVLIGFLNPYGLIIVLISSVASVAGGTSALAWMVQMMNRKHVNQQPLFTIERNWRWICVSAVIVLLYGLILGPSLRF